MPSRRKPQALRDRRTANVLRVAANLHAVGVQVLKAKAVMPLTASVT